MNRKQKIMLFGFRRNGTTMAFKLFRNLNTYCCFYEPLHPKLFRHKRSAGISDYEINAKDAYTEYARIYPDILKSYKPLGAPVFPIKQEMDTKCFTNEHLDYLKYLYDSFDAVLLQPVRIHCHLYTFHKKLRDYNIKYIWILRDPEGYVSSLMRRNKHLFKIDNTFIYLFFCKFSGTDLGGLWSQSEAYEYIFQKDRELYDAFRQEKLYVKLMLTWFYYFQSTVNFIKKLDNHEFAIVKYEDLCTNPALIMNKLTKWLDVDHKGCDEWAWIKKNSLFGIHHDHYLWKRSKDKIMKKLRISKEDLLQFNQTIIPDN